MNKPMSEMAVYSLLSALLLTTGCKPQTPAKATSARVNQSPAAAVDRAGLWMSAFPQKALRFDAAIGLHHILQRYQTPSLKKAYNRALQQANRDDDNPMRRFWLSTFVSPSKVLQGWSAPGQGESRVNVNRVVSEALHCRRHAVRQQTLDYIVGPMRDLGGYHTTHGLWALVLARQRGCLEAKTFRKLATPLVEEIYRHQPAQGPERTTEAVDIFAERFLMVVLAGAEEPQLLRQKPLGRWAEHLLGIQQEDGRWGYDGGVSYRDFHATLLASWALLEWSHLK